MSFINRETPASRFWDWFYRHSARLMAVKTGSEKVCDDLMSELQKVHKGLAFEFGPTVDGKREFIVSADGIATVFHAVKKLVAAAPNLPAWKVIAFRPPKGNDFAIGFGEFKLGMDDIWFLAKPAGQKTNLTLFIRGFEGENERKATGAAFLLLDAAIGEYNVVTKIGHIDMQPISDDPSASGKLPLKDLVKVIGS